MAKDFLYRIDRPPLPRGNGVPQLPQPAFEVLEEVPVRRQVCSPGAVQDAQNNPLFRTREMYGHGEWTTPRPRSLLL